MKINKNIIVLMWQIVLYVGILSVLLKVAGILPTDWLWALSPFWIPNAIVAVVIIINTIHSSVVKDG